MYDSAHTRLARDPAVAVGSLIDGRCAEGRHRRGGCRDPMIYNITNKISIIKHNNI